MSANAPTPKQENDLPEAAALSSLRNLLLGDEKVELDRVSADLDALKEKYGDQERFKQSVANVVADALTDARTHDQVRLSRAISPIVASSIKREIVNSKDEMVEALYPITGRLVAASVRNSITKLGEEINERLERMFSFRGMLARWRTQITGGNTAELMLADTQRASIQRAMIIERGSGILLGQCGNFGVPSWPPAFLLFVFFVFSNLPALASHIVSGAFLKQFVNFWRPILASGCFLRQFVNLGVPYWSPFFFC